MSKINLSTVTILLFSFVIFPFMYWEGNLTFGVIYLLVALSIAGYITATGIITTAKVSNIKKLWGYSVILIYTLTAYFTRGNDVFYVQVIPLFTGMMCGIIIAYTLFSRSSEVYSIPLKYLVILLALIYTSISIVILQGNGNMSSSSLIGAFMIGTMGIITNEQNQNRKEIILYSLLAVYAYFIGYYLGKYGNMLEIIVGGLILTGFLFSFFVKGFLDIGVQIFTVGFLFHLNQIVPILLTGEFQVLVLQIMVGSILKVTLWVTLTILTTWTIIKITNSRKIQVSSCLNLYPLAYWGLVAIPIKAIPYFVDMHFTWTISILLDVGTLTAWGISYYLLAKNLKKQVKSTKTAIVSALISGIMNFVLLPPPL